MTSDQKKQDETLLWRLDSFAATHHFDEDLYREAATEIRRLESFFAETLPFLKEAWTACFHGAEEKLLSAEERGMGRLLAQFTDIAEGNPAIPFGLVTSTECDRKILEATEWAYRTLGSPNELHKRLRRWVRLGETCADGLERANAEVERLTLLVTNGSQLPETGHGQ